MLGNILPPYHSLQELNLDWILTKIKNILRFLPDDGAVGQILRRTAHGAEWSDEQAAGVSSVNGQTGDVTLSIPDSTSDLVNDSGFVDAAGAAAAAPVQSVNGQTGNVISWLPYFTCGTAAATAAKKVTGGSSFGISSMSDVTAILVKFTNANSASGPTLEIDDLGALPIYQYGTTAAAGSAATTGWQAGQVVMLVYDGSAWYYIKGYNTNTTYSVDSVLCATAAGTAAKTSTNAAYYVLRTGNIFEITFRYSNTKASALTLNVNGTGAKPIYINGAASSSFNYTLPAGKYLCIYDGGVYHINTNGKAPIDITGTADGNYSVSNPPPYPVTSVNGQTGAVTVPTGSPLDCYPVGSIYMSVNSTSPSLLFGGTWQQMKDRFLLGAGDTYTAGDTGGEAEHTLTVTEMPSHSHDIKLTSQAVPTGTNYARLSSTGSFTSGLTSNEGGGQAHNNMPPYLVVYMWQRTA